MHSESARDLGKQDTMSEKQQNKKKDSGNRITKP